MKVKLVSLVMLKVWTLGFSLLQSQEFKSEPFGREVITIQNGFNYVGLRFHRKIVARGEVTMVSPGSLTIGISGEDIVQLNTTDFFLFEVGSGDAIGAVVPIVNYDTVANTITLQDDLSAGLQIGDLFNIRPSATIASVFGEHNESGLGSGATPISCDQVWLPDGSGSFNKYAYLTANPFIPAPARWVEVSNGATIDPHQISIYYPDGMVLLGNSTVNSFKVSGVVKRSPTVLVMNPSFNYFSSIYPAGGSIASMFGLNNESGLLSGFVGAGGADQIYIPNPLSFGSFLRYYHRLFDASTFTFDPSWADAISNGAINPEQVSFNSNSGFVLLNGDGLQRSVIVYPPSFYEQL